MSISNIIGSTGVALLLIAYFLNLFKFVRQGSTVYGVLNAAGAGLACYASILIGFVPFVVLEGIWAVVALAGIVITRPHD